MDIIGNLITTAVGAVIGVGYACWRLRSPVRDFATNLRSVLRTGGKGEEQ